MSGFRLGHNQLNSCHCSHCKSTTLPSGRCMLPHRHPDCWHASCNKARRALQETTRRRCSASRQPSPTSPAGTSARARRFSGSQATATLQAPCPLRHTTAQVHVPTIANLMHSFQWNNRLSQLCCGMPKARSGSREQMHRYFINPDSGPITSNSRVSLVA